MSMSLVAVSRVSIFFRCASSRRCAIIVVEGAGLHDELTSPLKGGMLPLSRMELVSDHDEPDWPFELCCVV